MRLRLARLKLFDDTGLTPDVRRGLYIVILGITLGQTCFTITGGPALTGFIRMLGGGDFYVSLLAAVPVIGGVLQLPASYLVERYRARRGIMIWVGVVQRSMWVLVALVPYIFPEQLAYARIWSLLTFVTISGCGGAFVNVSFMSLVADLVPMRIRGRYFAVRSRIATSVGLVGGILCGLLLDAAPGYTGYTIVFVIASVCGLADIFCFFFLKWPPMDAPEKREPMMAMLGQVVRNKPFMKLTVFSCMFYFSARVSGPFYTVFLLEHIKLSYLQITLMSQAAVSIATVLTITFWGRLMDTYGHRPVLMLCMGVACIIPWFWNYMRGGTVWLLPIAEVVSGAVWATIDLSFQNLYLLHAPSRNRSMYIAVYAMSVQLIGNAAAFLLGGFLVENVMPIVETWPAFLGMTNTRYNAMFALSSILRTATVVLMGKLIVESGETHTVRQMLSGVAAGARAGLQTRLNLLRISRARARYRREEK